MPLSLQSLAQKSGVRPIVASTSGTPVSDSQPTTTSPKLNLSILAKKSGVSQIKPVGDAQPSFLSKVGSALISSEKGLASTFGGALSTLTPEYKAAQNAQAGLDDMNVKLGHAIAIGKQQGKDTSRMEKLYQENTGRVFNPSDITAGAIDKTPIQVAGEAGGVGLDLLTAGSLAKGASSFKIFNAAEKAAAAKKALSGVSLASAIADNIEGTYKAAIGNKLINVAAKSVPKIAKGAAIGYGYDVSQGLQSGKSLLESAKPGVGTAVGALIPGGFAAKEAAGVISKETAPTIINSLIKPLLKDFSYGKDPGRAVAQEGIIANTFDGLIEGISRRRATIGQEIGALNQNLQGKAKLSLESAFKPIDSAMEEAAKSNNPTLLKRLQAVKEALTNNLALGKDELGQPTIVNNGPKNLKTASFDDAFKIKKDIGDLTQWTGNLTDDKLVNKALKQTYGAVKDIYNQTAKMVDKPTAQKLETLNEKYADLTSAEIAAKYRDKINARQNILSLGNKLATAGAVGTAILTGQGSLGTILAGVGGAVLDKAMGSTAVKTRIASWLAGEAPTTLERIFNANPKVRDAIYNAFTVDKSKQAKALLKRANEYMSSHAGLSIEDVTKKPGYGGLTTKLLEKLQGRDTVSKQFISDLTNSPDLKQVEKDLIRSKLEQEGNKINVTDFAKK